MDFFDSLVNVFNLNVWSINLFLSGVFTIIMLAASFKYISNNHPAKKALIFVTLWILSPLLLFTTTRTNASFIWIGAAVGIIILVSFLINEISQKTRKPWILPVLLALIIFGNLIQIINKNRDGEVLFEVQHKVILGDELKAIDWVYEQAGGKPFRLNTITNPLFINTTWALLFSWYGQDKYHYMPYWWGETQVDVAGAKVKFSDNPNTNLHFVIIEPSPEPDDKFIKATLTLEDSRSKVIETKHFGTFTVEKREITRSDRIFTSQDAFYLVHHPTTTP